MKFKTRKHNTDDFDRLLRIHQRAWDKITYLNSLSRNEMAGFGISDKKNPLFIKDIAIIKQSVSAMYCRFDDVAVADYFEDQVAAGLQPYQFGRIWIHTHPGGFGPHPSCTDEDTFEDVFGQCDWAVMLIVSKGNKYYARLSVQKGLKINMPLDLVIARNTRGANEHDKKVWRKEFENCVTEHKFYGRQLDKDEDWESGTIINPNKSIQAASHLPKHLHLPNDINESDFIEYCYMYGMFSLGNWTQAKLNQEVREYRLFMNDYKEPIV